MQVLSKLVTFQTMLLVWVCLYSILYLVNAFVAGAMIFNDRICDCKWSELVTNLIKSKNGSQSVFLKIDLF